MYQDITNEVSEFINYFAKNDAKIKLSDSLQFINENNIRILYNNNLKFNNPKIFLVLNPNTEIGYFAIDNLGPGQTNSLTISIEDDYNGISFQGHQLARLLITSMIYELKKLEKKLNLNPNLVLSIDGDGSGGFWDKIGMEYNRYEERFNRPNINYRGYQKTITLQKLSQWALNNNSIITWGGYNKLYKKKSNKLNKLNKSKSRKSNKSKSRKSNKLNKYN
jgi:hypothetical protein